MRKPVSDRFKISSPFGWRVHPKTGKKSFHNGIDIACPAGTPIIAPFDGVVALTRSSSGGIQLILTHEGGLRMGFAHLSGYADGIKPGVRAKAGQVIAYSGNTGRTTGPHLHFTTAVVNGDGKEFFNPEMIIYEG